MDMVRIFSVGTRCVLGIVLVLLAMGRHVAGADGATIAPAELSPVGTVDERFQSFNIEMVSVTGGPFWKPYSPGSAAGKSQDLFANRAPIDLASGLLRKLASALSPAYLRVSGTWANSTFFAGSDRMPSRTPAGYKGVLTSRQWDDVIDFSRAVDAPIVTSFAVSSGARDKQGIWTSDQAQRIVSATRAAGGRIVAAELMNEPDLPAIGGAPAGYGTAAFAADFSVFHEFMKRAAPEVMILAPGTAARSSEASDLVLASAHGVDAVSYHFYGALSERCAGEHTADAALSEEWLSRTDHTLAFYSALRDRVAPGKPIWLTETAEAACGGNRWSSTFLDTFRYLDQLGRLAKAGVQVVMHNTLVGSDYGLLEETTFMPRPNYWAALLWRQLMGSVVLDSGVPVSRGLHVYAHCQRRMPGGVVLLAINNDPQGSHELILPVASTRFALDAATLQDGMMRLNGAALTADAVGGFPGAGMPTDPGSVELAPATITFVVISGAGNRNCR